jgi:hypothetical protein
MKKKLEIFNISENNIISVKIAKVVSKGTSGYLLWWVRIERLVN